VATARHKREMRDVMGGGYAVALLAKIDGRRS
jgi:hypothetical protein